ncbi:MAG: EamA family transporter RarD [Elusimicrobiota bacterium]|nr:EamA family transporter RarD [Elusimicrobiota bacterium]
MSLSRDAAVGAACALGGFVIWGLSPLYWRLLDAVPPAETVMHRIVWSAAAMLALLAARGRLGELRRALTTRRLLLALLATTALIGCNWYLYVKAVADRRVLDASLGYFINPLLNVALGMLVLKERLRPPQGLAVALAAAGVLLEARLHGSLPWLSLALAATFSLYALLRKLEPVDSLVAVGAETCLLGLPCLLALAVLGARGHGRFGPSEPGLSLLLMGSVVVTALPLALFSEGARRLNLKTVGFLQFSSPSVKFGVAVLAFGEPLAGRLPAFGLIWAAVALYTLDAALSRRSTERPVAA